MWRWKTSSYVEDVFVDVEVAVSEVYDAFVDVEVVFPWRLTMSLWTLKTSS